MPKTKEGFQVTCSECGREYTAQRKTRACLCSNKCNNRSSRRNRLKAELMREFYGVGFQHAFNPDTGEPGFVTTVNITDKGWALIDRYLAKSGQTAEEWIGEQLQEIHNEILEPHGLEVGETRIVYPQDR